MCEVWQGEGCRQVLLFERGGEWLKVVGMIAASQALGSGLSGMKAVYLSSLFPTLPNLPPSSPSSSTFLPSFHTFHTTHPTQPREADSSATFSYMLSTLLSPFKLIPGFRPLFSGIYCGTCAFFCANSRLLVRPKSGRPGPGPHVQGGMGRPSNLGC